MTADATTDEVSSPVWRLAIDLGTTFTSATVQHNGVTELLMIDGEPRVPSTIAVGDDGEIVAGVGAERILARAPERAERNPKRRIGDEFFLLGDHQVDVTRALEAILRLVADEARRRFDGSNPTELILTHPARWGSIRLGRLAAAAHAAGLPDPVLVAEPVAAAWAAAATATLTSSQVAAIFDLGGGTLDVAVVRRSGDGFDVVGPPGGSDRIGGELFDERLYVYLGEQLAETDPDIWEALRFSTDRQWRRAAHDFRAQVRASKEALSVRTEDTLYLGAPIDRELRLTRDELAVTLDGEVRAAIAELEATVTRAGFASAELDHVFLVGGGSRMPLISQRVADWLGSVPTTWGDPKSVVAIGAMAASDTDGRHLASIVPTSTIPAVVAAAGSAAPSVVESASSSDTDSVHRRAAGRHRSGRRRALTLAAAAALSIAAVGAVAAIGRDSGGSAGEVSRTTVQTTTETSTNSTTVDSTPSSSSSTTSVPASTSSSSAPTTSTSTSSTSSTSTTAPMVVTTPVVLDPGNPPRTTLVGRVGGTPGVTTTTAFVAPPVEPPPTTQPVIVTTTVPPPPVDSRREVPYVVDLDFNDGQDQILGAGFSPIKNSVDCGGSRPSSEINAQSRTGLQEPNTQVVLDVCI